MQRILFLVLFCLLNRTAPTEAADNLIIVAGNPPLTREGLTRSQQFFEWCFGGRFTAAEQTNYQVLLAQIWHQGDRETIQTITQIIEMQERLLAASEQERAAAARDTQLQMVGTLRAQPKDPLAALLIGAYDRIHRLDARQGGPPSGIPAAPVSVTTGESGAGWLTGEWQESHVGGTEYRSSNGSYSGPNGEKILLRFFPDSTYKSAYMTQAALGTCSSNVYIGATGVYRLEANALHLQEKTSRMISKDSCRASYNYDRNPPPGKYAYPWQRGRDQNGEALVLHIGGKPHTFYRQQGTGLLGP